MFNWFKNKKLAGPAVPEPQAPAKVLSPEEQSRARRLEGNAHLDKGDLDGAAACYQQAVNLAPDSVDARVNLGFTLVELQRHSDAQPQLSEAIRLDPHSHDAFYLLGTSLRVQGQLEQAIAAWRSAIALKPEFDVCRRDLTHALVQADDLAAAEATVTDGLVLNPGFADFHHFLGNIHVSQHQFERAESDYLSALALDPEYGQVHQALGETLKVQGKFKAAIDSHRRSVTLNPASADARARLAAVLHDDGQLDAAVAAYRQALALDDGHAEVYVNMGFALQQLGQLTASVESARKAIALRPDFAGAHTNLGDALAEQGDLEEATGSYREALRLLPNDGRARNNLAGALLRQGKLEAAIAAYEKALELNPDYIAPYSNLLFTLNYHPDKTADEIFSKYREFDRRFAIPLRGDAEGHPNDRHVARRLKVGYVSPDFRAHPVRHFLEPLFEHHDKSRVEVHAYADVAVEDGFTANYRRHAGHWTSIRGMTDGAVAERIRADSIDILVDLAGHTGDNRLGIFARKPAPVSLSWLGFGYTSGLSAIDYFLTDEATVPQNFDHLFAERPWRISTPSFAFRPVATVGLVSPLPAVKRGFITFGTLTRAIRINHRSIRTWSEILRRVKRARLVIDSLNYQDASVRHALVEQFAHHNIGPERLEIGFHTPPWDVLRGMDIGLDCFPHNSGTTLFESLYMGVPFVTLAGRPSVGRLGSSILQGVGHPEWIAQSEDEYIEKAVALAGDASRLAVVRSGLRAEMQASPLMDEAGFARRVETAYREMFAAWATSQP